MIVKLPWGVLLSCQRCERQRGGNMHTPKRPRDPAQLAKLMVDMTTGQVSNDKDDILTPPEDGRSRSGHARAEALTPERRREIAQRAAVARWHPST